MEINSNQNNKKSELEARIITLEETKSRLQHEIASMHEKLTNNVLEKKAKGLEGDINNLRNVKIGLMKKTSTGKEELTTEKVTKSPKSPIRYGTWSKLPVT